MVVLISMPEKDYQTKIKKLLLQGSVAGAKHVHLLAKAYGVPVILHTDHCAKKLLPWIDGLLDASEEHFAETGKSLYQFTYD